MNMVVVKCCLALAFFAFCQRPYPAESPADAGVTIRARQSMVEVVLSVREGSRYLGGLTGKDFSITVDGSPQEVCFFQSQDLPLSVALVLDTSGSMKNDMEKVRAGAAQFVRDLRQDDRVSLITFGGVLREVAPFTRDREKLLQSLDALFADGSTPLYDAVVKALSKLEDENGRRAVVVFTDAGDNDSRFKPENVAKLSGRAAIPVFCIGVGDSLRDDKFKKSLEGLSEITGGEAYLFKEIKKLGESFLAITERLKASYRAGFYPTTPMDGKWHDILVQTKSGKGRVSTRKGYYAR